MAVSSTTDAILSAEEMLARSRQAVQSGNTSGQSEVEKLLAGREDNSDILDLTPVQRMLKSQADAAARQDQKPYTEQDWFIRMKVAQLRGQLQMYNNLPGLDPTGAIMDGLEAEIKELAKKQQSEIQRLAKERKAKAEELAEQRRQEALAPLSAEEMLARSKTLSEGGTIEEPLSKEAQALLDGVSGSLVDTTA